MEHLKKFKSTLRSPVVSGGSNARTPREREERLERSRRAYGLKPVAHSHRRHERVSAAAAAAAGAAGVAPPAWHVRHPIEHLAPLRACGEGTFHSNRPTDMVL